MLPDQRRCGSKAVMDNVALRRRAGEAWDRVPRRDDRRLRIMAEAGRREAAIALLGNTILTGAIPSADPALAPISGAHFNPGSRP
jgi:hypothetical protein